MNHRISKVKRIKVHNIVECATAQFGDSIMLEPNAKVFAVQKEIPIFYENEGYIDEYPTFFRQIPKQIVHEAIKIKKINKSKYININNIYILSTTTSSIFHVGSTRIIRNEGRVKNIHHLYNGHLPSDYKSFIRLCIGV